MLPLNRIKETYRINNQITCTILESKNDINGNTKYKYLVVYSKYLEEGFSSSCESFYFWGYGFNSKRELIAMVMKEFCAVHNITGMGWRENFIIENCVQISEWFEKGLKVFKFFTTETDDKASGQFILNRGWVN